MKRLLFIFLLSALRGLAQDQWTPLANFGGIGNAYAVGFSIGNKGYFVTTESGEGLWEFDPSANSWTQKADLPVPRGRAVGFSIGSKGYVGTGGTVNGYLSDFWEWDQSSNSWTRKADFGGGGRYEAFGFSIGNKGYIGNGNDSVACGINDFWEWDQLTDTWTQRPSFPGLGCSGAAGLTIGSKGYICNDQYFWEWDPANMSWTQKTDYPGLGDLYHFGFSIGSKGYIGGGIVFPSQQTTFSKDFWEYDPVTDAWTQRADFGGGVGFGSKGFSIGSLGYAGIGNISQQNGFWEYSGINSGIPEGDAAFQVFVYPNPVSAFAIFHCSKWFRDLTLNVYTMHGEKISTLSFANEDLLFRTEQLPAGVYFWEIRRGGQQVQAGKIIAE